MSPLDDFEQAIDRLYAFRTHEADEAALDAHRACLQYLLDAPWWDRLLGLSEVRLAKLTRRYHEVASRLWITDYEAMNGGAKLFTVYARKETNGPLRK